MGEKNGVVAPATSPLTMPFSVTCDIITRRTLPKECHILFSIGDIDEGDGVTPLVARPE